MIQTNETGANAGAPKPSESAPSFSSAPQGMDHAFGGILDLTAALNLSRVDASVEPYLQQIEENLKGRITVERVTLPQRDNYYAYLHRGDDGVLSFFGLLFVATTDGVPSNFYPASMRAGSVVDELREKFKGEQIRVVDSRVVISNHAKEMERSKQMANTILQTLKLATNAQAKAATISDVATVEFSPDWNMANVRAFLDTYSPHAVMPRMDLGMVLRAKIPSNNPNRELRDMETQYRPIGVIAGYVDFLEQEPVDMGNGRTEVRYVPIFNVTVAMSLLPYEGMGLVLMAALGPNIYRSLWWTRQWSEFKKDLPNPGTLDESKDRPGQPDFVENAEELRLFIQNRVSQPDIAYQLVEGRDNIPGFFRMFSEQSQDQAHFIDRVTHFFEAANDIAPGVALARLLEYRFDGVFGQPDGVLRDSREIDYLSYVAQRGHGAVNSEIRRVLLGGSPERPAERAAIVSEFTGSFVPIYLNQVSVINASILTWAAQKIQDRGMAIVDPSYQTEARSYSSIRSGFANGSDMPSVIQSGHVRPTLNLNMGFDRFGR